METGHEHHSHDYSEAEVHHIERVLKSYGVLTRDRLFELAGANLRDATDFERALAAAVRHGSVKKLSDELYEIAPE